MSRGGWELPDALGYLGYPHMNARPGDEKNYLCQRRPLFSYFPSDQVLTLGFE